MKKRSAAPPLSVPKAMRTPPSDNFFKLTLFISKPGFDQGSLRVLQLLLADLGLQHRQALRRHELEEERIVDPSRRVAVDEQPSSRTRVGISVTLRCLSKRDEFGVDFPVAHVVGQDVQSPLHEHLRVGDLVGMAERELAVLARLVDDGGAELRAELGARAEPAVHPQFDIVGAGGDGLDRPWRAPAPGVTTSGSGAKRYLIVDTLAPRNSPRFCASRTWTTSSGSVCMLVTVVTP